MADRSQHPQRAVAILNVSGGRYQINLFWAKRA
jgi:hypothetical protein